MLLASAVNICDCIAICLRLTTQACKHGTMQVIQHIYFIYMSYKQINDVLSMVAFVPGN